MENTEKQPNRFSRLELLVGENNLSLFSSKCVLILGVGGVGSFVVEGLVRSRVSKIIIVDYDIVDITNINRQILALTSTIGKKKVDVLEERILDINPDCQVIKIDSFITDDNISCLFQEKIDYFIDCCDTVSTKKRVLLECIRRDIPFISSMGTGNKLDPTQLEIVDIRKTSNDPLARILRKYVKDQHITKKVMVLCSKELPIKTGSRTVGSTSFVPSSAGLMIASYVVREWIKKNQQ